MKPTTAKLVKEARERRAVGYCRDMRDTFASFHRSNRNTGKYGELRSYSRARANYLLSINY